MATIYVAGQHPGVGSTSVVTALAIIWKQAGWRVAVVKPASLSINGDSAFYARTFASPNEAPLLVAEHDLAELQKQASGLVGALAAENDVVIVEGLPFYDDEGNSVAASPALAEHLSASVLGVVAYDRTLLADAPAKWQGTYASLLSGVVINRLTRYGHHDAITRIAPAFEAAGVPVYGTLPEERQLLAPTVSQIATLLGGTFYAGASAQHELVESFLIGGLITEWGGNYFGRNPRQAVIVRGGRIDIQMSALNFPLTCLLLTGCEEPAQYVHQRANDLDVPLVTSPHDTPSATALLECLDAKVTIDHPDKIKRIAEMFNAVVDFQAIAEFAGLRRK
jgi:BioD-like phosphotransacetylase family protein